VRTDLLLADWRQLEEAARKCDAEASRLNNVLGNLDLCAQQVFSSWKGLAAHTLNESIHEDMAKARQAQARISRAAHMLRSDAAEARAEQDELRRREQKEGDERHRRKLIENNK
jgi:hypothetical protein